MGMERKERNRMKSRMMVCVLAVAALSVPAFAVPAQEIAEMAQPQNPTPPPASPLPLPASLEKELAAKAANATEVTLNKDMLGFASKFMNGKDKDEAAVSQLIQGLDGIYVRDYEFAKEGDYSMDDIDKLRQAFETPEWTPMVRDRERNGAEITDVMVKLVNGETRGMFILSAEPKELSIVLILGNIHLDQLGMLKGLGGLGALGGIEKKDKERKAEKAQDKAQEKANKGGDQ